MTCAVPRPKDPARSERLSEELGRHELHETLPARQFLEACDVGYQIGQAHDTAQPFASLHKTAERP